MTLKCRFFSDGSEYHQPDFAKLMKDSLSDGYVRNVGNELEVIAATPYNMTVEVKPGRGYIQGYSFDVEDTTYSVPIAAADPDNPRIDRIVARLSVTQNRNITLIDLQGVPSASPEPPELTRDTETYDISLAQILVEAGASSVPAGNITDERNNTFVCGIAGQRHGWFDACVRTQVPVAAQDIDESVSDRDPVIMSPSGKWVYDNTVNATGIYYAGGEAVVMAGTLDGYSGLVPSQVVNAIATAISEDTVVIRGNAKPPLTYTFTVNQSVSAPENMVSYQDDAVGMTRNDRQNLILQYVKPCVVKNAVRQYYLNPLNLNQKADGTASDLTGTDGDVCLEIPTIYLKYSSDGSAGTVSFTFKPTAGYTAYAHRYGDRIASYIWLGMFEATGTTCASVYSASATPKVSQKLSAFRTQARTKGDTYNPMLITGWSLYQTLVTFILGTTDTQSAVGNGNVSTSAAIAVGAVNGSTTTWLTGGAFQGDTVNSNTGVIALWMVNPWGNVYKFCDGIEYYQSTAYVTVQNNEGHDIEQGRTNVPATWEAVSTGLPNNLSGQYITKTLFDGRIPWFPTAGGGTSSTFYCDGVYSSTSDNCCLVGGFWGHAALAGLFCVLVGSGVAGSSASIGARLQIHSLD